MRFLHTADWHVGKKLGRIERAVEFEAAFDEIVAIARDEKVDAVLVSGDLLDRALPPLDSLRLVIDALIRLADASGRVVAIAGNHDSPALMEMLAPLLRPHGVILCPRILSPEKGGVIEVPSIDGTETACIGAFPFLHEAQVVDFMEGSSEWFKQYGDKVLKISSALCSAFDPRHIGILMAHYFVDGAEVGGGERTIHLGQQYAATSQSVPPGAAYVALGHIHRPQAIPGTLVPSRYSGSLIQLDFSERTHNKEVVVVDAKSGAPARVKSIQLASGRKLIRVTDDIEALRARAGEFSDAYLDVRIKTSGPVFGLFDQVREFLPHAVMVQAVYERAPGQDLAMNRPVEAGLGESYASYHVFEHGVAAPSELLDALRSIEDEVSV